MSADRNGEIIRALYAAADAGQLDAIARLFADDFRDHEANPARADGGSDKEGMLAAFREFSNGFPDTRHTLHDVIEEGDRVVVRVSAQGSHTGTAFGHPATGRRFRNDSIVIYRLAEGRIVEKWSRERRGIMDQLADAGETGPGPEGGYRFHPADELVLRDDVAGARFFEVSLERSMLTYFELEAGAHFPRHRHESEQITLVLEGHLRFVLGDREVTVGPGEAIALRGNEPHAVESLDRVVAVDAWSPPPARFRAR